MPQELKFGTSINELTVLDVSHKCDNRHVHYWVVCSCGNITTKSYYNLVKSKSKSCGFCNWKRRQPSEYAAWASMHERCNNPRRKEYKDYGGRGIKVCERWSSFVAFFTDLGIKPFESASLERQNNDGNYEPDNCKWATKREQALNRRIKNG